MGLALEKGGCLTLTLQGKDFERPGATGPLRGVDWFTHDDPGYAAEYERVFRCPVIFGADRNAIEIEPAGEAPLTWLAQWAPPSLVCTIVAPEPTDQPFRRSVKNTLLRLIEGESPLTWAVQWAPPSLVCRIVPSDPTAQPFTGSRK